MKKLNAIKSIIAAAAISLVFSGVAGAAANGQKTFSNELLKTQAAGHRIEPSISLQEALKKITNEAGISFKVGADISKDKVGKFVSADSWREIVRSLLVGYNWVAVQEGDALKTVIITGKNPEYAAAADEAGIASPLEDDDNQVLHDQGMNNWVGYMHNREPYAVTASHDELQ